jgi:hypothetical protein
MFHCERFSTGFAITVPKIIKYLKRKLIPIKHSKKHEPLPREGIHV